jgi:hypothetical protein
MSRHWPSLRLRVNPPFSELDWQIMLDAQKTGREVFHPMNALLPRELCDHILSYLIPRCTTQCIQDVFPGNLQNHCCSDVLVGPSTPPASMLSGSSINHHQIKYIHPNERIYLVDCISYEAATQAAERYYQINTFSVLIRNETESLRHLLSCDRFRLGLQPSGLIRKLEIEVFAEANSWHNIKRQPRATLSLQKFLEGRRRELTQIFAILPPQAIRKMEITFEIGLYGKFASQASPAMTTRHPSTPWMMPLGLFSRNISAIRW